MASRRVIFDHMTLSIETERESPGRWIAEVLELPGVMVYGTSRPDAVAKVKALARRVLAERIQYGEQIPGDLKFEEQRVA